MRMLRQLFSAIVACSWLVVLCITATELAIYMDDGFYEKEYRKYNVLEDLQMEMDDVMYVTREMMDYLHGARDNLEVETIVAGERQPFFNGQDKFHMEEVRGFFQNAVRARLVAFGGLVIGGLLLLWTKGNWRKQLAKWYLIVATCFTCGTVMLAYIISRNFELYFVLFHELFFDNDLWLFDPKTDLMIRMLPEGLFADFSVRIGLFVAAAVLLCAVGSWIVYRRERRREAIDNNSK